jgi:hypothetical protein
LTEEESIQSVGIPHGLDSYFRPEFRLDVDAFVNKRTEVFQAIEEKLLLFFSPSLFLGDERK